MGACRRVCCQAQCATTGIERRHVETARWIRQGRGERNNHLIILGPEVGRPRIYAHIIKRSRCVANFSKSHGSMPFVEKETLNAFRPWPTDRDASSVNITGPVSTSCTSSFSQRLSRRPNQPGGRHGGNTEWDSSIGSVANHNQTHPSLDETPYCLYNLILSSNIESVSEGASEKLARAI